MAGFETIKLIPYTVPDLKPTAKAIVDHFTIQGYETTALPTISNGWQVSLAKGGGFKKVLGTQMALNVSLEARPDGTLAKANIGVFGQQALPTIITAFVFWPILLPQIWGAVQQSKLDDEVIAMVERELSTYGTAIDRPNPYAAPPPGAYPAPPAAPAPPSAAAPASTAASAAQPTPPPATDPAAAAVAAATTDRTCSNCGTRYAPTFKFCPECGTKAA